MDTNKKNLLNVVKDWIDERTGLIKAGAEFLHEEIPGGTRFSYTLGSACLFLLTIQIVTGVWQLFYYVPTIDYAYSSLSYLRLQVPWGWMIHGFHYWGGTLFSIVVGLHALRVFIWGSYKKPREMVWLIGIVLILLTALFMFTGPVLPWDKTGYWAGQVGIGIAGSVPIIGPFTEQLLQGANKMGQMALLRIYVMHVALLPGAIALFVVLHLVAFRKYGESGPWDAEKRKKVGYFWPEQIFKDVVVSFLIFLLLVFLSAFFPAPFAGLADPMDTLVTPKPAWNFLFLYQILKFLPGPLEALGTAGVPLFIVLLFGSLPFLDTNPERNPFKRGFVVLTGLAFVAVILTLTWMGYVYRSPAELAQMEPPYSMQEMGPEERMTLTDKYDAFVAKTSEKAKTGKQLFKTLGCTECHTTTGVSSDKQGPDLLIAKGNHRTHDWLYDQIISPQKHNPKTIMPPYGHLSPQKVDLLISYLRSLRPTEHMGPPVSPVPVNAGAGSNKGSIAYGKQLVNIMGCAQCHTIQGRMSNKAGPDLILAIQKDKPSKDWLKTQLVSPQQHNPTSIMPSFASRMNEKQLDAVVDYLESLKSVKISTAAAGAMASENSESASSAAASSVEAINIIGDREHGAILFHQSCIMCHGPHGDNRTPGFTQYLEGDHPPKGVPALNPIPVGVFSKDPQLFVDHIDQFIQKGAPNPEPGGPAMPNFGESHALTQAQIADLEAYILSLNGVDRTLIINPGMEPHQFFYMLLWITMVIVLLAGCYWFVTKLLK